MVASPAGPDYAVTGKKPHTMKRLSIFISALAAVLLAVSACEKEAPGMYHDYSGKTVSLLGCWGLVEVQYWTAGVVSTEKKTPESLIEFQEDGKGRSLRILPDGGRELISTFHWEKYPGSVTIFSEEEFENNRCYTDEDMQYMPGLSYEFKVIDADTISSREKISSGSYMVNVFARF